MEEYRIMSFQLIVYVPETHTNKVKEALFNSGAGRLGAYDKACWQCSGQGQFRPSSEAMPAIGSVGKIAYVNEDKVEIICKNEAIVKRAIEALKKAHPYEEPAYAVIKLENIT